MYYGYENLMGNRGLGWDSRATLVSWNLLGYKVLQDTQLVLKQYVKVWSGEGKTSRHDRKDGWHFASMLEPLNVLDVLQEIHKL
jgi:hypothetical protein